MSLRVYLRTTVSHDAMKIGLPRLSASDLATILAWAYGALGLNHLDKPA